MKRPTLLFFLTILITYYTESNLYTQSSAQITALGEILTVELNLIDQWNFTYDINPNLLTQDLSGLATIAYGSGVATLNATGAGSATLTSKICAYSQPGQGISCVFGAMYQYPNNGDNAIAGIGNIIDGAITDGFFFQLSESGFGILYVNNSSSTTIAQADWNVDPMDGSGPSGVTLDYTVGNIYQIEYPWLPFGNINFFIESPFTGLPVLVHQIQYANNFTITSLSNPGLQMMAQLTSLGLGDKTNITLLVSSMSLLIEGSFNPYLGIRNTVSANNDPGTTLINILTIQNDTTFNLLNNQIMVLPDQLSLFNTTGSGFDTIFSLYLNPTVGGTQIFTATNSNSVVSYDVSGTTVSGGTLLGTFFLASGSNISINLVDYGIKLSPGDQLVFACFNPTSDLIKPTVYVSVSWIELF